MESSGDLRVSSRGQMSLPAAARTRWELINGGTVGYLDLGDAVLLMPGGVEALRRRVFGAVTEADREAAASGFRRSRPRRRVTVALIDDQALGAVPGGEPPAPLVGRALATTGCW